MADVEAVAPVTEKAEDAPAVAESPVKKSVEAVEKPADGAAEKVENGKDHNGHEAVATDEVEGKSGDAAQAEKNGTDDGHAEKTGESGDAAAPAEEKGEDGEADAPPAKIAKVVDGEEEAANKVEVGSGDGDAAKTE